MNKLISLNIEITKKTDIGIIAKEPNIDKILNFDIIAEYLDFKTLNSVSNCYKELHKIAKEIIKNENKKLVDAIKQEDLNKINQLIKNGLNLTKYYLQEKHYYNFQL